MIELIPVFFNNHQVEAYSVPAFDKEGHNFNLSLSSYDPKQALLNRKNLAALLDTDLDHMIVPHQEHTVHFRKVSLEDGGKGMYSLDDAFMHCDGLYTTDSDLILMTSHADCCPVLLYDSSIPLIAAIHSGWKGTVHEITGRITKYLIEKENVNPLTLKAFIGPSIEQRNFEAMDDIIDAVKKMSFNTDEYYIKKDDTHYLLNSKGLISKQLTLLGIPEKNIFVSEICTMEDPRYFSYRKTKTKDRNMCIIRLRNTNI